MKMIKLMMSSATPMRTGISLGNSSRYYVGGSSCLYMLRTLSSLFRNTQCEFSTVAECGATQTKRASVLTIGIPRETYNLWERRSPLTPSQVKKLIQESGNGRLAFAVQPSARRIFTDHEYIQAGAVVSDDLSSADVIMGVKRPRSESLLLPNKTYMFFSHTVKGQPENMTLLQECMQRNVQLIDYERITTDKISSSNVRAGKGSSDGGNKSKNKRLVTFGRYAGIAGTIDAFHALGRKLLYKYGANTPFLSFPPAIMHDSLELAMERLVLMAERIVHEGVHLSEPLVFAVTGKGGCVHGGAMEILQMLPHEIVAVTDLPQLCQRQHHSGRQHKIHVVPVDVHDVFQRRNGDLNFERHDFKTHPTEYRSLFAKRVAPYSHVIINCAYWDARFPRLLTKRQMKRLREDGNDR
jgi:alpha-aminoadipic semialdehyde synthase